MLNLVAIAGVAVSLLAGTVPGEVTSTAVEAAPAEKVVLDVVTVNGSGCPAGSASVTSRADNTAFTVSYNDFLAQAGSGSNAVDSRKNCQINVLVRVPAGFTYAIARADYRGFAHLQAGATALQIAHYYIMGQSPTAESRHTFYGPMHGDWRAVDEADALIWAPCGVASNLNINTELRVDAGSSGASSFVTMDSTRGAVRTVFNFSWREC